MKILARHNYLQRRGAIWHYRRVMPKSLRSILGNEFKRSLRTTDRNEAQKQSHLLNVEVDANIEAAKRQLARQKQEQICHAELQLTQREIQTLTFCYLQQQEEKEQNYSAQQDAQGHLDRERLREIWLQELDFSLILAKQDIANERGLSKAPDAIDLLVKYHFLPTDLSKDPSFTKAMRKNTSFQALCRKLMEADSEIIKRQIDQFKEGEIGRVHNQYFAHSAHEVIPEPDCVAKKHTVRDLIKAHEADPARARRTRHADTHYKVPYRLLREEIGEDKALCEITREEIKALIPLLESFPSRGTTRFRKSKPKTLRDIVAIGKRKKVEPAGPQAINRYLTNLSSLFDFAVREQMIAQNPAKGVRVDSKGCRKRQRQAFSIRQLQSIFRAPLYTGCLNDHSGYAKKGTEKPRRGRFWVPLLALFTGMRMNEICSLEVEDITKEEEVWVIKVQRTSMTGTKSLKTEAAERLIPVHSELVRIGFLTFVSNLPDNATRLFPDLSASRRDGKFTDPFTKWFSRFLRSCKAYQPETTFHSFRHGVSLALKNAEVYQAKMDAVMGWEDKDRMSSRYGKHFLASQLVDVVEAIQYPGLDLSHLYPEGE